MRQATKAKKTEARKAKVQDLYQTVTDQILELMEKSGTNWIKEWAGAKLGLPANVTTDKYYQGTNIILLNLVAHSRGYSSNYWAGYHQLADKGYQVKKGEKGTQIIRVIMIKSEKENSKGEKEEFAYPIIKPLTVFNIEQTDIDPAELKELAQIPEVNIDERDQLLDDFLVATGAKIKHNFGDRAFYSPSEDEITLPSFKQFHNKEAYYATALHELVHWTGNKDRLNRLSGQGFGSEGYAKEELIAELGATFLSLLLGVTPEPRENHAKYLSGWLKALKNDKHFIVEASTKAERAVKYLLNEAGYELDNVVA